MGGSLDCAHGSFLEILPIPGTRQTCTEGPVRLGDVPCCSESNVYPHAPGDFRSSKPSQPARPGVLNSNQTALGPTECCNCSKL